MDDINLLVAIAMFMAGIFGMAGLRLWFITHQDVNMSKKVNGLSIDMGKIKKLLKDGLTPVQTQTQGTIELPSGMENMTLEGFADTLGFDMKELNNPLVRPMAEKIFEHIKSKAGETDEHQTTLSDL